MKSMVINDVKYKRPKKGMISLYAAIAGLLIASIYLYISNFKTVNTLITFHNPKVVYKTYSVAFGDDMPEEYINKVKESVADMVFNKKPRFEFVEKNADINIEATRQSDNDVEIGETLIPVGHIYSLKTSTDEEDIKNMHVYVLDDIYTSFLKEQYAVEAQKLDNVDALVSKMKENDSNVGLISYTDLDYRMRVLKVGDKYYLDDHGAGVTIKFYVSLKKTNDNLGLNVLTKNIDFGSEATSAEDLLKLNMTGVVAISRDLGIKINSLKNWDYPAEAIGSFLADADLTHVSNEASFFDDCVINTGMRFCSKSEYLETLTTSGVDIVELTGNHNNDYGSSKNAESITATTNLGMKYFGGGLNNEDASKILYEDVNNTTVAFIGYNWYDTTYKSGAIAWDDDPGANEYSEEKMAANIAEAKANADVVIVDFQFQECYCYPDGDVIYPVCYKPLSNPDQESVFRKAIDLGATIVIGTQAHQPQTYELYGDGVIFYGLGNLYFDQDIWIGTRQGLVLTHYFDNGKYINTKITPIYMDSSLQPNFATQAQGDQLLKLLKTARESM